MSESEELHIRPIPMEMTSPPFGAKFSVHEDHGTVELPYMSETITVLPGETVTVALAMRDGLKLVVTRGRE